MILEKIMVLGIGSILFSDEGFGIRVIEELDRKFDFPENVSVVDGGVLGVHLLGVMSEADHLVVIDAVKNKGNPGDLYRIEGKDLPERIRSKNSLHQIDFLESLTLCQALDKVPETVVLGMEPLDIETLSVDMTEVGNSRIEPMIEQILLELDRLDVRYQLREPV